MGRRPVRKTFLAPPCRCRLCHCGWRPTGFRGFPRRGIFSTPSRLRLSTTCTVTAAAAAGSALTVLHCRFAVRGAVVNEEHQRTGPYTTAAAAYRAVEYVLGSPLSRARGVTACRRTARSRPVGFFRGFSKPWVITVISTPLPLPASRHGRQRNCSYRGRRRAINNNYCRYW